jgi:hypothetical protein
MSGTTSETGREGLPSPVASQTEDAAANPQKTAVELEEQGGNELSEKECVLDERKRRIGEKEANRRRVNEMVRPVEATWMTILCECGNAACREHLVISQEQYQQVRQDSTLFMLRPDHDIAATEYVVSKHVEFWIVRKDPGVPAELARATDPAVGGAHQLRPFEPPVGR